MNAALPTKMNPTSKINTSNYKQAFYTVTQDLHMQTDFEARLSKELVFQIWTNSEARLLKELVFQIRMDFEACRLKEH